MIVGNGGHAKVVRDFVNDWDGAIVAIGDNATRKKEAARIAAEGWKFLPAAVHPRAYVAGSAVLGEGTVVMAGVTVQPEARIGKHVILNTNCSVDHECVIEDFAHIAPGVHLCGGVHVGEGALVGVGSCAVPGAKIPAWSLVKAGSVVIVEKQEKPDFCYGGMGG